MAEAPAPMVEVNLQQLNSNKVGALFVFFATSFCGVFLPYFIPVKPNFLKFGLLFSSGLFLGLAFLHLAPDCIEAFEEFYTGEYPLAWILIPLGFYMTWFTDEIAQGMWKRSARKSAANASLDEEKCGKLESINSRSVSCCRSSTQVQGPEDKCRNDTCPCSDEAACQCAQLMYNEGDANGAMGPSVTGAISSKMGLLDVILLLIALCFHAYFEGLAVGLTSTVPSLWKITIAICVNEFFEGMALGTTLRAQDANRTWYMFALYAVGASIVAPLGVATGIILNNTAPHESEVYIEGIGLGLAAGVFLCIATRHLIAKAMVPSGPLEAFWMPFAKFFMSGFGLMVNALLTMLPEE